ncbi:MAG: methyltransferase domain-containing protein [Chitinophagaceae bacterium]|nr:methyltransferase domain-containing protein [Chitinophagaceae bacterium]
MRASSYILSAKEILSLYKGELPFAAWIKQYFKTHKKFGSRDRKIVAQLCYSFFRLGNAFNDLAVEERIGIGLFLSSQASNNLLEELRPGWNAKAALELKDKFSILNSQFSILNVFPWNNELSEEINSEKFNESFLIQPDLFLRLRHVKENIVKEKLAAANIDFRVEDETCLALPNASKLDGILLIEKEAVIQDHNSQRVLELLQLPTANCQLPTNAWDCCAASGGKSILVYDTIPNIDLTVSDIRVSILINLKKRFEKAGIKNYKSFIADLSHSPLITHHSTFDLIICDAPCTGSGTWSRTPEQLHFFKEEKIDYYAPLQKKIAINASKSLKKGGHFLYITCSVFKKENEEVVEYLKQNTQLQLQAIQYYKGYEKRADTLFTALFTL